MGLGATQGATQSAQPPGVTFVLMANTGSIPRSLRMPVDLKQRVTQLAERERRSFNSQALVLIERGLEAAEACPPDISTVPSEEVERLAGRIRSGQ
jgi:hypothetical protein